MGNCLNDGDYDSVENPQCKPVSIKIKEGVIVRVKSMNDFYEFKKEIGKGATGSVFLCIEKGVGHKYAIKKMLKPQKKKKEFQDTIKNEEILSSSLFHPNVIKCYGCYKDDNYYYIIQEYAQGGDLCDFVNKTDGISVSETRQIIRTLLFTIVYCHYNEIIHRDVKPENILLTRRNDIDSIKLTDFGLASLKVGNENTSGICGTPEYIAPEILQNSSYNYKVDIWSVGVITYFLICNTNPFIDSKFKNKIAPLLRNICRGAYNLNNPKLKDVPKSLKKFIKFLLVLDPSRRPTADQALHHEFMLEDFENLSGDATTDIVEYNWMIIRRYQTRQRWKILAISIRFCVSLLKKFLIHIVIH